MRNQDLTKLFIIGDSTANNAIEDQRGWGDMFTAYLDTSRVDLHNRALGGRSTRSFRREAHWNRVLNEASPGDYVLIQFGHNDAKSIHDERARGTIHGIGEQTETGKDPDGQDEIIHTFGSYLRHYLEDATEARLRPVLLTSVPLCPTPNEPPAINPLPSNYAQWTGEVAQQTGTPLIDAHRSIQAAYDKLPADEVRARYFSTLDTVHTNQTGAALNASIIARLIADRRDLDLSGMVCRKEASSDV